ncbi:hypothetical protein CGCTS75_v006423 [Colletotrichum tropicale]|nr:hypothetical protein CGCTS75_v006423 [Colletotrichum tropicale]
MQLIVSLLVTFAAFSAAFNLPEAASDDVYMAYYNDTGHEVHVKSPDMSLLKRLAHSDDESTKSAIPRFRASRLQRRGTTWCGCTQKMNPGNCDSAVAGLKSLIDSQDGRYAHITHGRSLYVIKGDVVAFICNRSRDADTWINANDYGQGLAQITSACGLYSAGTLQHIADIDVGYMIYGPGVEFCQAARTSPASSC